MGRKRNMPSKIRIVNYWKNIYKHLNLDEETCFKCSYNGYVERAHINSVYSGGSDDVNNLHLLCKNCHNDSEAWEDDIYRLWFEYDNDNKNKFYFIEHLAVSYLKGNVKLKGKIKKEIDNLTENYINEFGIEKYNEFIKNYFI